MEAMSEQPASPATAAPVKQRYPLRSAGRQKARSGMPDASVTSLSKRERSSSFVSKSVDVLNLSAKEKSAKSPRRLSNPAKLTARPRPTTTLGSITPISETRMKKETSQGIAGTPHSEVSTGRRKFNVLTSVSYWLTQIKLAESTSKHSISLGFFKLALESGCEPLQRMREELKLYTRRHNLVAELGEPTKDLLQCYNILEDFQKLRITSSQVLEVGDQTLDGDTCRQSAISRPGNLKPRSLNSETSTVPELIKKERAQKRLPAVQSTVSSIKNSVHPDYAKDANGKNTRKKNQKPSKVVSDSGNSRIKCLTDMSTNEKVDSVDPLPVEEISHEDKENMDTLSVVEARIEDEIETC